MLLEQSDDTDDEARGTQGEGDFFIQRHAITSLRWGGSRLLIAADINSNTVKNVCLQPSRSTADFFCTERGANIFVDGGDGV